MADDPLALLRSFQTGGGAAAEHLTPSAATGTPAQPNGAQDPLALLRSFQTGGGDGAPVPARGLPTRPQTGRAEDDLPSSDLAAVDTRSGAPWADRAATAGLYKDEDVLKELQNRYGPENVKKYGQGNYLLRPKGSARWVAYKDDSWLPSIGDVISGAPQVLGAIASIPGGLVGGVGGTAVAGPGVGTVAGAVLGAGTAGTATRKAVGGLMRGAFSSAEDTRSAGETLKDDAIDFAINGGGELLAPAAQAAYRGAKAVPGKLSSTFLTRLGGAADLSPAAHLQTASELPAAIAGRTATEAKQWAAERAVGTIDEAGNAVAATDPAARPFLLNPVDLGGGAIKSVVAGAERTAGGAPIRPMRQAQYGTVNDAAEGLITGGRGLEDLAGASETAMRDSIAANRGAVSRTLLDASQEPFDGMRVALARAGEIEGDALSGYLQQVGTRHTLVGDPAHGLQVLNPEGTLSGALARTDAGPVVAEALGVLRDGVNRSGSALAAKQAAAREALSRLGGTMQPGEYQALIKQVREAGLDMSGRPLPGGAEGGASSLPAALAGNLEPEQAALLGAAEGVKVDPVKALSAYQRTFQEGANGSAMPLIVRGRAALEDTVDSALAKVGDGRTLAAANAESAPFMAQKARVGDYLENAGGPAGAANFALKGVTNATADTLVQLAKLGLITPEQASRAAARVLRDAAVGGPASTAGVKASTVAGMAGEKGVDPEAFARLFALANDARLADVGALTSQGGKAAIRPNAEVALEGLTNPRRLGAEIPDLARQAPGRVGTIPEEAATRLGDQAERLQANRVLAEAMDSTNKLMNNSGTGAVNYENGLLVSRVHAAASALKALRGDISLTPILTALALASGPGKVAKGVTGEAGQALSRRMLQEAADASVFKVLEANAARRGAGTGAFARAFSPTTRGLVDEALAGEAGYLARASAGTGATNLRGGRIADPLRHFGDYSHLGPGATDAGRQASARRALSRGGGQELREIGAGALRQRAVGTAAAKAATGAFAAQQ